MRILFFIGILLSIVSAATVASAGDPCAAPGCNQFGCWQRGGGCDQFGCWTDGGGCNQYGCWNTPTGSCNQYGCTNDGVCSQYGCP